MRKGGFSERKEHKEKHGARHVAVWRPCAPNRMHGTQASDAGQERSQQMANDLAKLDFILHVLTDRCGVFLKQSNLIGISEGSAAAGWRASEEDLGATATIQAEGG